MRDTVTEEPDEPHGAAPTIDLLFRVMSASAPLAPPSRHALTGVDTVEIGRGAVDGWTRSGRALRVDVADDRASKQHARLTRKLGRWQLADLASKNGTAVGGQPITVATLAAGEPFEIGRTVFVLDAAAWFDGAPLDGGPWTPLPGMPTVVPRLAAALAQVAAIAPEPTPVLVRGPSGTGKELLARAIHAASARGGPFVAINGGAIPRELVESTLFGHRRGAFSGAVDDQPGALRAAHGGTLLLDEVGDLPLPAQAALLRALQEREVLPVGSSRAVPVDLRIVAATHRELAPMIAAGTFRADLYYRLRGFEVELPALADRLPDLGVIVAAVLARHAGPRAAQVTLHPRAVRAMFSHRWPGNVRELEHALAGALALAGDRAITADDLRLVEAPVVRDPGEQALRDQLVALLTEHAGAVRAVARAVGKDPVQIRRWLRRFGLDPTSFRA